MSHENVQIVREAFDLTARRDASVFDAFDPEVEMDFSASPFADFMTTSPQLQGLGGFGARSATGTKPLRTSSPISMS